MKRLLLVAAFAIGVSMVIASRRTSDSECEDDCVQDIDIDVATERLLKWKGTR
jgi:hypothetical protein